MKENIILETHNIAIGYSKRNENKIIAENISIRLRPNKLTALIGANGAGKSTLLRTLTALQKPLLGDISMNGKPLSGFDALSLAKYQSVVLTEKLPPSNLSVYELVALGRQPYTNWIGKLAQSDLEHIQNALDLTGTNSIKGKKHYEISDGQLQKVLVARAIAQDTPLIILDEPTTHLDISHKISVFRLMRQLSDESGKTILFSTHDIELSLQICDEVIIMSNGKVLQATPKQHIESGILNELFQDPNVIFDSEKVKFVFKGL